MKKIMLLVLLSTEAELYAQTPQMFEDGTSSFSRSFTIALDRNERMQLDLTTLAVLPHLPDIDLLVKKFQRDLKPVLDTMGGRQYAKRIDYMPDEGMSYSKLRYWTKPGKYYVFMDEGSSLLKMEQDTITITGSTSLPDQFYRISFYLSDIDNLNNYHDRLNSKVHELQTHINGRWVKNKTGANLRDYPHISAPSETGKVGGTLLLLRPSLDVQNYRESFIPSVSLGLTVATRTNTRYREYGLGTELHFRFANDPDGKKRTFTYTFITASYGRGRISSPKQFPARIYPFISIGYLVNNKQGFYEKNTFKIGAGRFYIGNRSTKIEPMFYVGGFFKNVTPSFRVVQAL